MLGLPQLTRCKRQFYSMDSPPVAAVNLTGGLPSFDNADFDDFDLELTDDANVDHNAGGQVPPERTFKDNVHDFSCVPYSFDPRHRSLNNACLYDLQ